MQVRQGVHAIRIRMRRAGGESGMTEQLDVTKRVSCPADDNNMVNAEDCIFCEFYHGMGDLAFTLICGYMDHEKHDEHKDDGDE